MSDTGYGKVVVNRAMSLDGFIAVRAIRWIGVQLLPPDDVAAIAAETGAMLVGRRTWDVGAKMKAEDPGSTDYPFSGAMFLLSHRPLDPPDPGVSVLSGDIGDAVATALDAAAARTWRSWAPTLRPSASSADSSTRSWSMYCRCCSATAFASLLGHDTNRAGTAQQQAVRRHNHPPVPRPQVGVCPTRKETRLVAFSVAHNGTGRSGVGQCSGMTPDQRRTR